MVLNRPTKRSSQQQKCNIFATLTLIKLPNNSETSKLQFRCVSLISYQEFRAGN
jgi:hypothetical protein